MKIEKKSLVSYGVLAVLLLLVLIFRISSSAAEWYATHIYPCISFILSRFSSIIPFSLGDLFIFLSILWIIAYPFYTWYKKRFGKRVLLRMAVFLLWIYVWFYLAWGINYFRKDFYARVNTSPALYSSDDFQLFLINYVKELNASYIPINNVDKIKIADEIMAGYRRICKTYGLACPWEFQQVKTMMFTPFISKVGISGYMGPFFSEFNLNGDLLPSQYASTYAHEMAHLLGITSEAEANLYAYVVCTASSNAQIRFSGYLSLLPHVLRNAHRFLSKDEYEKLINAIHPEIIMLYENNRVYWQKKYSAAIGDLQDTLYDWFLKSNQIDSGIQNYSEVIELLITLQPQSIIEYIKKKIN